MSPYSTLTNGFKYNIIFKQNNPIDIFPKFDIYDSQSSVQENITKDIVGSPFNHTEWVQLTNKINLFEIKLKNITKNIKYNGTAYDHVMNNYDDVMWTVDKLKNATPDIKWDKIFLRLFGQTLNITEKIVVLDDNYFQQLNDVMKQLDKR